MPVILIVVKWKYMKVVVLHNEALVTSFEQMSISKSFKEYVKVQQIPDIQPVKCVNL